MLACDRIGLNDAERLSYREALDYMEDAESVKVLTRNDLDYLPGCRDVLEQMKTVLDDSTRPSVISTGDDLPDTLNTLFGRYARHTLSPAHLSHHIGQVISSMDSLLAVDHGETVESRAAAVTQHFEDLWPSVRAILNRTE